MTSELRPAVETRAEVLDQLLSELQDGNAWDSTISLLADYADLVQDLLKDREAVRAEQAAELAKFKVLAETLAEALEQYDQGCAAIGGCSDGYCVIQRPKGMHTNGGCRCSDDRNRMRRFASRAAYFREKVAEALLQYKEARDAS